MPPSMHDELASKKCLACEGGVPLLSQGDVLRLLHSLPGWTLSPHGHRIYREWTCKHFMAAMEFLNRVAFLAEDEGHHPDMHLTGYRTVMMEVWTHAVGGLTENDFILSAKIDKVPIKLKD